MRVHSAKRCPGRHPEAIGSAVQSQLAHVAQTPAGPFTADWNSLGAYRVPERYGDAKFGIFIHRGVFSVPAFDNEWYPRNMCVQGSAVFEHHAETYGSQARFGYKDFIPMFRAEQFDPDAWGTGVLWPGRSHFDATQPRPAL